MANVRTPVTPASCSLYTGSSLLIACSMRERLVNIYMTVNCSVSGAAAAAAAELGNASFPLQTAFQSSQCS